MSEDRYSPFASKDAQNSPDKLAIKNFLGKDKHVDYWNGELDTVCMYTVILPIYHLLTLNKHILEVSVLTSSELLIKLTIISR